MLIVHTLRLALATVKCYLAGMAKSKRRDAAALFVRVSKKEKKALDDAAKRDGFSNVSQWLRVMKLKDELSLANA